MEHRVKQFVVEGLFGMFRHEVPLNLDTHITIVYGENGIGKTMLFRIVDALFRRDFDELRELPFQKLVVEMEDESELTVENRGKLVLKLGEEEFVPSRKKEITEEELFGPDFRKPKSISQFKAFLKELIFERRKGPFSSMSGGVFWTVDLVIERYYSDLRDFMEYPGRGREFFEDIWENFMKECSEAYLSAHKEIGIENIYPKGISKFLDKVSPYFIRTQRLLYINSETDDPFNKKRPIQVLSVDHFSERLGMVIQRKHQEYQFETEVLESSLRSRLSGGDMKKNFEESELKALSEQVARRRKELMEVGLLDESQAEELPLEENLDELSKAILGVNLTDMRTKLAVFDDVYKKLSLLLDIINNRRFSYKTLSIHPERGFQFRNSKGEALSLHNLSSGEQHELILIYQLLFEVPNNAMILLDEPEISLHIAWQKEFVQDMSEIIKLRGFDIVIATHSPSIVNGEWDLTVSLKGGDLVHG